MDVTAATVTRLAVHRVGNKLHEEGLVMSASESPVSDDVASLIVGGYLRKMLSNKNAYHFHHEVDIDLNEARCYASQYFLGTVDFLEMSRRFAARLYENSTHPNIRSGEFLVVLFSGLRDGERDLRAIGLFKSELLNSYLAINEDHGSLNIVHGAGINPNTIDKGAIIVEDSYDVFALDRAGSKTKFWVDDFLKAKKTADPGTSAKVMSYISAAVAETIQEPVKKQQYGELVAELLKDKETASVDALAQAAHEYIEQDAYESTVEEAKTHFGLESMESVSAPSAVICRNLERKTSRLSLGYGVSLVVPTEVKLLDFQANEGAGGEIVFTVQVRRSSGR